MPTARPAGRASDQDLELLFFCRRSTYAGSSVGRSLRASTCGSARSSSSTSSRKHCAPSPFVYSLLTASDVMPRSSWFQSGARVRGATRDVRRRLVLARLTISFQRQVSARGVHGQRQDRAEGTAIRTVRAAACFCSIVLHTVCRTLRLSDLCLLSQMYFQPKPSQPILPSQTIRVTTTQVQKPAAQPEYACTVNRAHFS